MPTPNQLVKNEPLPPLLPRLQLASPNLLKIDLVRRAMANLTVAALILQDGESFVGMLGHLSPMITHFTINYLVCIVQRKQYCLLVVFENSDPLQNRPRVRVRVHVSLQSNSLLLCAQS